MMGVPEGVARRPLNKSQSTLLHDVIQIGGCAHDKVLFDRTKMWVLLHV